MLRAKVPELKQRRQVNHNDLPIDPLKRLHWFRLGAGKPTQFIELIL